jgi:class 3 adenylate cyclase
VDQPETRYATVGDTDVAYQVVGDGPIDLVYFLGPSHIDLQWEHPLLAGYLERLASFSRLILFDRRGVGASARAVPNALTWEDWVADLTAVLDAVGSERTAIFGEGEAGPIAVMFTAMKPERVHALILANSSARNLRADDYPIGLSAEAIDGLVDLIGSVWGTTELSLAFPTRCDDAEFIRWTTKLMRAVATPREAKAQYRYILESMDVREALPLIRVPTLVLHSSTPIVPVEHGRYLAAHIEGANFVDVPGADMYLYASDNGEVAEEACAFLTGEHLPASVDRVLATVLFTDIVESTGRVVQLGDRSWRSVLDRHDRVVRERLRRFRGREVNTTGDGFVASFDGPARAIRCARAILESLREVGVEARAGIHTGECEVRGADLTGVAVHIAARVCAAAGAGEVLVTGTVQDLVAGSGIVFGDRGLHELKGVPDKWRLLAVESA